MKPKSYSHGVGNDCTTSTNSHWPRCAEQTGLQLSATAAITIFAMAISMSGGTMKSPSWEFRKRTLANTP